ncbi:MAG TPA: DNA-formamidopyrimidine glycosylase family protein [Candidatus Dormibacteraeota bacterium]
MPEGDTIWRTAELLRTAIAGKRVKDARPDGLRRVVGSTVTAVEPVGKHLFIRFDNGFALHSHMRMRGIWQVSKPGEPPRRPEWQLKARLETEDAVATCFGAPVMELIRNPAPVIGHLGPDILRDDWSAHDVVKRARSMDGIPIAELLLDQRVTAGIGNVYRCEALWQQKINPWMPVAGLSDEDLCSLFTAARNAMRANLGPAWQRRFPSHGRGAVYGRSGRPCPRCGTVIQARRMGENARVIYWCPRCQGTLAIAGRPGS